MYDTWQQTYRLTWIKDKIKNIIIHLAFNLSCIIKWIIFMNKQLKMTNHFKTKNIPVTFFVPLPEEFCEQGPTASLYAP